jgi:hypothetical protein
LRIERIVPAAGSHLLYARHIDGDGRGLFEIVCREDLEGVVAKWKLRPYLDGSPCQTPCGKTKNSTYSPFEGRSAAGSRGRDLERC